MPCPGEGTPVRRQSSARRQMARRGWFSRPEAQQALPRDALEVGRKVVSRAPGAKGEEPVDPSPPGRKQMEHLRWRGGLRERLARRDKPPAAGPATAHQPPDGRQHMQEEERPDVTRASHPEEALADFLLEPGWVDELRTDVPGSLERQAAGGLRPADLVIPQLCPQCEHVAPLRQRLDSSYSGRAQFTPPSQEAAAGTP